MVDGKSKSQKPCALPPGESGFSLTSFLSPPFLVFTISLSLSLSFSIPAMNFVLDPLKVSTSCRFPFLFHPVSGFFGFLTFSAVFVRACFREGETELGTGDGRVEKRKKVKSDLVLEISTSPDEKRAALNATGDIMNRSAILGHDLSLTAQR